MHILELRKENLRHLVAEKGGTAKFASLVGRDPSQISQHVGKKSKVQLGEDLAREFEQALNLPKYWFDQLHNRKPTLYSPENNPIPSEEYVWFPFIDTIASIASDKLIFSEDQWLRWPLDLASLKLMNVDPHAGCFLKIEDEAMPQLSPGDVVFVDTNKTNIKNGHVYAIKINNEIQVRRLFREFDNTCKAISDNTAEKLRFPDMSLPAEALGTYLIVIGEVMANILAKVK